MTGAKNPDTTELVRFIQNAVTRMRALVDDLLNCCSLTSMSAISKGTVDLTSTAEEAVARLHAAILDSGAEIAMGALPKLERLR